MNDVKFSTLDILYIIFPFGKNIFTIFYPVKGLTRDGGIAIL